MTTTNEWAIFLYRVYEPERLLYNIILYYDNNINLIYIIFVRRWQPSVPCQRVISSRYIKYNIMLLSYDFFVRDATAQTAIYYTYTAIIWPLIYTIIIIVWSGLYKSTTTTAVIRYIQHGVIQFFALQNRYIWQ